MPPDVSAPEADISADVDLLSEGDGDERSETPSQEVEAPSEEEATPEPVESEEQAEEEESATAPPTAVYSRPPISEIKQKFPELFKAFPSLRDMYFREAEFSKMFPTVDDAKEASYNAENYEFLRDGILEGDVAALLDAAKGSNEKSFERVSEKFLPALYKISPDAHWKAIAPTLQNIVRSFYNEGVRNRNEDLKNSALHLSNFLFNDVEIATGKKTVVRQEEPLTEERQQLNRERESLAGQRHADFSGAVYQDASSGLLKLIGGDKRIDPDNVMSPFVRDTIIQKVVQEVGRKMEADPEHMRLMNSLWEKARRNGYRGDWKSRITTAYLARAKSLVPSVRSQFIAEALGSSVKSSAKRQDQFDKVRSRVEPGSSGRPARITNHVPTPKEIDWGSTSDLDIINDNYTLRKNNGR